MPGELLSQMAMVTPKSKPHMSGRKPEMSFYLIVGHHEMHLIDNSLIND